LSRSKAVDRISLEQFFDTWESLVLTTKSSVLDQELVFHASHKGEGMSKIAIPDPELTELCIFAHDQRECTTFGLSGVIRNRWRRGGAVSFNELEERLKIFRREDAANYNLDDRSTLLAHVEVVKAGRFFIQPRQPRVLALELKLVLFFRHRSAPGALWR
jgi:hypothetical protein